LLTDYFHHYAIIGFYLLVATLVPIGMIVISRLASFIKVRPSNPSELKKSMYNLQKIIDLNKDLKDY